MTALLQQNQKNKQLPCSLIQTTLGTELSLRMEINTSSYQGLGPEGPHVSNLAVWESLIVEIAIRKKGGNCEEEEESFGFKHLHHSSLMSHRNC